MSLKVPLSNGGYYAKKFSELSLDGSRYLQYRDVSQLIKNYVNGSETLDFGCGPGQSLMYLKSLGLNVEGMDISEEMINLAKQNHPSGKYEVIECGRIPRKNNSYDFVFAGFVLVHAATKKDLYKMVKEIARVLKKGGIFIALVTSEDTFNNEWLSADTRFNENLNLYSGKKVKFVYKQGNFAIYSYYWTTKDYQEIFSRAGMEVVHIHQPFGRDSDGYQWINEKEKAYVSIFVAQKV